jgi:hypothetical protein
MLRFKHSKKVIGFLIVFLSYGFVLYKLIRFENWSELKAITFRQPGELIYLVLLQIALIILNLSLESKKWQILLNKVKSVRFASAYKMVLAGFSSGIFTPSKIGEPIGRLMMLPKTIWPKALILNYAGGIFHSFIIFICGIVSVIYIWNSPAFLPFHNVLLYTALITLFVVFIVITLIIFKDHVLSVIKYFRWEEKWNEMLTAIKTLSYSQVLLTAFLSLLRYSVYSIQLAIFLYFFKNDIWLGYTILLIPIYYLTITAIPSFLLADLGIRNSIALLLFSQTTLPAPSILLSVSILWIINQALPASIGSLFIYKHSRS